MTKTTKMKGNFDWQIPEVVVSFIQGEDALDLYQALGNVPHNLTYDEGDRLVTGSNNIGAVRIDSELRSLGLGIRVANLRDLSRPEVMERIRGRHYSDAPALALVSHRDDNERNNSIIKQLIPLVEELNGKLELPLLVTGYDYEQDLTNTGYSARIVARDDFEALHDERFKPENNKKRFTEVDKRGVPIFDKSGTRTFFVRQGLSGLGLNGGLGLCSDLFDLGVSYGNGRVFLVSDGGAVGAQSRTR